MLFVYHCRFMTPILGRFGPNLLYSYTIFIGLGIAAGLGVTAVRARLSPAAYRLIKIVSGLILAGFGLALLLSLLTN